MKYMIKTMCLVVVLVLICLTACSNTEYLPEAPLGREHYAAINLEEQLKRLEQSDREAVDFWKRMGDHNQLEDVHETDPIDVGLHFAGYANIDNIPPDKIQVFDTSGTAVTLIVLATGVMDDSISAHEHRIDLRFDNGKWKIEWAGYRQKCRRTPDNGWITGLCS